LLAKGARKPGGAMVACQQSARRTCCCSVSSMAWSAILVSPHKHHTLVSQAQIRQLDPGSLLKRVAKSLQKGVNVLERISIDFQIFSVCGECAVVDSSARRRHAAARGVGCLVRPKTWQKWR
jgi:hypothetical protein